MAWKLLFAKYTKNRFTTNVKIFNTEGSEDHRVGLVGILAGLTCASSGIVRSQCFQKNGAVQNDLQQVPFGGDGLGS